MKRNQREHILKMERYENNYLDEEEFQAGGSGVQHQQHQHQSQVQPHHQPSQTIVDEAELLAAQAAAEAAAAQQQQQPGGAFNNVGQGLTGKCRDIMMQYWQETINSIEHDDHDFKNHQLPLARIKKVMKTDEDVRMISAEAPILFAKGCDVFITELTMRAWIHAEENKRRTLQKSDIAAALTKSDMFDFLIDVVPREEERKQKQQQQLLRQLLQQLMQLQMMEGLSNAQPLSLLGSHVPAHQPQVPNHQTLSHTQQL